MGSLFCFCELALLRLLGSGFSALSTQIRCFASSTLPGCSLLKAWVRQAPAFSIRARLSNIPERLLTSVLQSRSSFALNAWMGDALRAAVLPRWDWGDALRAGALWAGDGAAAQLAGGKRGLISV